MATRRPRRGFGKIKTLPSKRFQASYVGPDLARHAAPRTFEAREDAEGWLLAERRLLDSPEWVPPKAREAASKTGITLRDYASDAIGRRRTRGRPLKPRTVALYAGLLDRVILPVLGDVPIRKLTAEAVSAWYDDIPEGTQRAHAYALIKSLIDQAISERKVTMVNPCTINGAGVTHRKHDIRPATLAELEKIISASPERLRMMFLLCAWCGLRFGEAAELRRSDVDLTAGVLRIRRGVVRVNGEDITDTPKSAAGARDVAIPPHLLPALETHMEAHAAPGAKGLLFPYDRAENTHWQHGTIYRYWSAARKAAGRTDLRLHDLRHTSAVMAASTGATLAELMLRLGHSTPGMALRYQHVAAGRDAQIAEALSKMAGESKH